MQVLHTGTQKGGLPVSREPCKSIEQGSIITARRSRSRLPRQMCEGLFPRFSEPLTAIRRGKEKSKLLAQTVKQQTIKTVAKGSIMC